MDEDMMTLHNIMPVELAIRREMEYRSQMEVLKNRRLVNLNPLLPSQVHPTSQHALKRKEPSTSGTALGRRSTGFVCKICHITFGTLPHLNQHSETSRHKGNLLQLKKQGKNVSCPFACQLCDISCSSGLVMADHLRGTKHSTMLQDVENAKRARAEEVYAANMY
ncbi:Zinc finger, C2H2 [Artemisia annua]|uniref:Zinc finger, C2H2 n=1 Tax=Artemisia annua TaxID=35608 RepID=A0A2U1PNZ7_ARTAN|nr:Zinc finger, C2H2 [Artemisia annua]